LATGTRRQRQWSSFFSTSTTCYNRTGHLVSRQ
jgi:hypothetical protein